MDEIEECFLFHVKVQIEELGFNLKVFARNYDFFALWLLLRIG